MTVRRVERSSVYRPEPLMEENPARRENRAAGWHRFHIGDHEATVVSDGRLRPGPPEQQFPEVPKEAIFEILRKNFLPTDGLIMEQNCLVLRTARDVVLFDSGIGVDKEFGCDESGRMADNMRAAGIDPREITSVVLTHAHCDHCWGLTDATGERNFPNAEICIARGEYEFWTDERRLSEGGFQATFIAGARRSLLPYRDRLRFVSDEAEVVPGITAVSSPGHSFAHTSYIISSDGYDALLVGDVVHSTALLFENPDWGFSYDFDPILAAKTRRRILDRAVSEDLTLIGFHFPYPGVGRVRREGEAFAYVPAPIVHK
jgi:glyoxylase-like metal-dependent hydrolase (beta-lactamase superfamily II)